MQVRMLRRAATQWKRPMPVVARLFEQFAVLDFIRDGFGIFHVEGDEAVFEEVQNYLKSKGVEL